MDFITCSHAYLFRGNFDGVKVKVAQRTLSFADDEQASFTTMRSKQQCPIGSKGYYEISLIREITSPKWGFASERFARHCGFSDEGVGDDEHSWAIDGHSGLRCHDGIAGVWEGSWKAGDVIGLACDLTGETMQMLVSVNGSFASPSGLVFNLKPEQVGAGLFAAFSGLSAHFDPHFPMSSGEMQFNLGETPFKYRAPSHDYKSFVNFSQMNSIQVFPSWKLTLTEKDGQEEIDDGGEEEEDDEAFKSISGSLPGVPHWQRSIVDFVSKWKQGAGEFDSQCNDTDL